MEAAAVRAEVKVEVVQEDAVIVAIAVGRDPGMITAARIMGQETTKLRVRTRALVPRIRTRGHANRIVDHVLRVILHLVRKIATDMGALSQPIRFS